MALRTAASVRAASRNNGVRSAPRRVNTANSVEDGVRYKISKGQGRLMMMVAALLDLLPLFVLVGVAAFAIATLTGGALGSIASGVVEYTDKHCTEAAKGGAWGGGSKEGWGRQYHDSQCKGGKAVIAAGVGIAGLLGLGASLWVYPIIFFVSTAIAGLLALLIFPVWFAFLRYNMVSFGHPKKIMVNFISFLTTGFLKWMPVINLFPSPVYTLTVWSHLRLARAEDKEKHKKVQASKRAGRNTVEEGLWEA